MPRGRNPNSLKNLQCGRTLRTYGEPKVDRRVSVTATGWQGIRSVVQELGYSSVSEFLEEVGRRRAPWQYTQINADEFDNLQPNPDWPQGYFTEVLGSLERPVGATGAGVARGARGAVGVLARYQCLHWPYEAPPGPGAQADSEGQGQPIGANDLLIAATARAHDLTLITHNVREFLRVAGLRVEDWEASAL
ncbi:MAG: hypothetical protein KME03_19010 [Aphanocapsa lilacina HA4352-LM1]|jgi:tRNA(fMet)-specific endonuclease VapC|nr:hypothetical protein [Aphanocapsa lilacina HA4352-LM1]